MTDVLAVILRDTVAGTVTRLSPSRLRFDYDASYMRHSSFTPLSLTMPTTVRSHPNHIITPWLWGVLPDSQAVLERWARQFHVSPSSPAAFLSTPVGEDCPGAVRFVRPEGLDRARARAGDVVWLDEDGVGRRLRDLRQDATAWLGRDYTGQFSLAGVQAKTALLFQGGRWGVPTGATPTTHILKPAIPGLADHDLNEHLCLAAARRVGLVAVESRVCEFGGERALVVERYDRVVDGDRVVRLHQEDLCQALGFPPWRKYQNEGGPGPAEVARLLRRALPPERSKEAVARFADALIWNWIIGGTDAHAKNYSLMLEGHEVRLGPLYDLASALPYSTHTRQLRMAMKIGGHYDLDLWPHDWPRAAADMGLRPETLLQRVRELAGAAADAFATEAAKPEVQALKSPLVGKLVDLVARRAGDCLRLVSS